MADIRLDAAADATTVVIPAPGVGMRTEVLAIKGTTDGTAGTIRFHDDSNDLWGDAESPIIVGINLLEASLPYSPSPWFECAENEPLSVTVTGTALVGIIISRMVKV